MKCLVTGAAGFVGAHLVRELARDGHTVRALVRPGGPPRDPIGADCEIVEADIVDPDAVGRAVAGCDWCFHVAASYHLWLPDYRPMYAANVEGTRCVLGAARAAGCSRIVYTSTVGCVGLPCPDLTPETAADESLDPQPAQLSNHYKRSKWQAELAAREIARQGAPVVIVNPSTPVGHRDAKPTPTGRIIVDFLNGRMPAYMDTGLNWVDVRDVARGHILAAQRGEVGQRYILGHAQGNWSMKRTLDALAAIAGKPAPRWRVPYFAAWLAAALNEGWSALTGHPPAAPLAGVRMARYRMYFNPAKAIRELGLPQNDPRQAIADAVAWFFEHGFLKPANISPI